MTVRIMITLLSPVSCKVPRTKSINNDELDWCAYIKTFSKYIDCEKGNEHTM